MSGHQPDEPGFLSRHTTELERQLAEAREQNAGLAAALERLKRNALEMAGYVKSYGLDDRGPQSEWSRWSQCRTNIENEPDPAAILARVRAEARREGAVEELGELLLWGPTHISAREVLAIKEYRDEIRRRIAELRGKV